MKAAREAFEAQLLSVLNQEQQVKFEALKAARQMRGAGRRGRHGGPAAGAPADAVSPPRIEG
jgi:hypothetical protein